jgi:hypothetical protein
MSKVLSIGISTIKREIRGIDRLTSESLEPEVVPEDDTGVEVGSEEKGEVNHRDEMPHLN